MSEDDFRKLVQSIDSERFKYDFEYSKAFDELYGANEKQLTDEQKNKLRWEVFLFRLRTVNRFEQPQEPRFMPMAEFTDGRIFPDPDGFDKNALEYFRSRVDETKHSILRARYLDIIWEKGGKENKFTTGKSLVNAYIQAFTDYPHDYEIERLDSLYRALEIALALESKNPGELTEKALKALRGYINQLHKNKNFRWMIDAVEILISKAQTINQPELKELFQKVEDAIDDYHQKDPNIFIEEALLKLKLSISSRLDGKYTPNDMAEDIAKNLITEAERRKDSLFVQQHFYSEAAKIYQKAGMKEKADEMVRKIRELGQSEDYDKQFQTFSHEIAIPQEEINKLKEALRTGDDTPLVMGLSRNFVPDWGEAKRLADELGKKYVAHKIFTKTTIGSKGYPVSTSNTDEDYITEQLNLQASLKHNFLKTMLREKVESGDVKFSNFSNLFKKIREVDEKTFQSVKVGLRAYFRGDYFASTMILTTQFEDFLRGLMPLFGLNPTRHQPSDPNVYEEKTMNRIIEEYKKILGDNTYFTLKYTLVDKKYHYLRHRVAHGFLKSSDDNQMYATIMLQLFCMVLARIEIKKRKM